jgi:hypothetical protein
LRRKRTILNRPRGAAVGRLHDPGTAAGVTDQCRRAGHRGERRDTDRWGPICPGGAAIVGHDDRGIVAAVVTHGDACRGARRAVRRARDRPNVCQGRVRGSRLPAGSDGIGRSREQRTRVNETEARQTQSHGNGRDGDAPNRFHGTSSVSDSARPDPRDRILVIPKIFGRHSDPERNGRVISAEVRTPRSAASGPPRRRRLPGTPAAPYASSWRWLHSRCEEAAWSSVPPAGED